MEKRRLDNTFAVSGAVMFEVWKLKQFFSAADREQRKKQGQRWDVKMEGYERK